MQATRVFDAYPIEYQTFENLDFSTVKGMTVSYDYRRVKHLAFRASYTLQFAEGTGSSATSQLNLARSGAAKLEGSNSTVIRSTPSNHRECRLSIWRPKGGRGEICHGECMGSKQWCQFAGSRWIRDAV